MTCKNVVKYFVIVALFFINFQMHCYFPKHDFFFFFHERVFDPSYTCAPAKSCNLFIYFFKTLLKHACRTVPGVLSIRHKYKTPNKMSVSPRF